MRRRASRKNRYRWKPINGIRKKKRQRKWDALGALRGGRERERFRAHRSYNINDPVCTRACPVESWIPGQPPSRPIYISVLFKHDCYSISTQLVNALLFNRVARRRAGLGGATRHTDVRLTQRVCEMGMRNRETKCQSTIYAISDNSSSAII